MKKLLYVIIIATMFSNCGIYFKYVKTSESNKISLKNKNIGIIDINIPVYLVEKTYNLKSILYNDILTILKNNDVNIYDIRKLKNETKENIIYKNDIYNWFFRSDSNTQNIVKEEFNLENVDYLINIDVLKYEKGTMLNNSWIKLSLRIYNKNDLKLIDIISFEGFYKYVKEEMKKVLK